MAWLRIRSNNRVAIFVGLVQEMCFDPMNFDLSIATPLYNISARVKLSSKCSLFLLFLPPKDLWVPSREVWGVDVNRLWLQTGGVVSPHQVAGIWEISITQPRFYYSSKIDFLGSTTEAQTLIARILSLPSRFIKRPLWMRFSVAENRNRCSFMKCQLDKLKGECLE